MIPSVKVAFERTSEEADHEALGQTLLGMLEKVVNGNSGMLVVHISESELSVMPINMDPETVQSCTSFISSMMKDLSEQTDPNRTLN